MRKTPEQLEQIKKKFNVSQLFSWSRYNCYKNSIFEYYLKYILKIKEDRDDGIYGISGNACHTILEGLYSKEIKYENMLQEYEDALFTFKAGELKYDRCNKEKNDAIANKYEACIKHFFQNHTVINKKLELEKFITIKINSFIFQGYVDAIHKEDDYFIISDWKSSSIYTGKKIDKEKGQLILYTEGIRQLGIPLEKIKARWNFLKYVMVEVQQANGKSTERNIVRTEIGESLKSNAKMWLTKAKCYTEEEIDSYLDLLESTNDINNLPEDIKIKYKISDCYVYIPITEEAIDSLKSDIVDTIACIGKKEIEYFKTKDERIWWEEVTDGQSYYFANLSGYSAKLNKPYGEYLEKLNAKKELNKDSFIKDDSKIVEDDLSWLEQL